MCLGIPGKITQVYQKDGLRMGKVNFDGVTREVCLTYVPEANLNDYVIVHVGFAISQLSEQEAQETLALLHEMADLADELNATPTEARSFEQRGRS